MRPAARKTPAVVCLILAALAGLALAALAPAQELDDTLPGLLDRPLEAPSQAATDGAVEDLYGPAPPFLVETDPPAGYTGPSSVAPQTMQSDGHFVPVEDRWRIGIPAWDRYGKGHPPVDDYPLDVGQWWDPYHQNVLKGDYPIIGQHTFLEITGTLTTLLEPRGIPTATTPFESTARPFASEFFGNVPISSSTRTSSPCRSTCSTAMPRSSRSTGASR